MIKTENGLTPPAQNAAGAARNWKDTQDPSGLSIPLIALGISPLSDTSSAGNELKPQTLI
jgi:hypothetical protein